MHRKLIYPIVLLLLASMLFVACTPAATEVPGEEPVAEEPAAEEPAAEEPVAEEPASEDVVELCIESWRVDDLPMWEDTLLPEFHKQYPNIHVNFTPVINTEYSSTLATKIEGGIACDLIMVEPFDLRLYMYDDGDLADLTDLPAMENYSDLALSAWSTDDGSAVYGVPLAAVLHGFIYNKDIFDELGLKEPTTTEEFIGVLDAVKENGTYTPLAMGTTDYFVPGLLGFQLIGPAYWHGEEGRKGLIAGTEKFTDPQYVAVWDALTEWTPYLPDGYEAVSYGDMQNLFTLGEAAVYPAGSWEIAIFNNQVGDEFAMGAFPPPIPEEGAKCFVNDHMDMGMALNANAENPEEAKEFLNWLGTAGFAEMWNNELPGFFSLSNHVVDVTDPLAQEFISWRAECDASFRNAYKIISRSQDFNTDTEINRVTALVMNGEMTPEEAAEFIQDGLASWYEPQQD